MYKRYQIATAILEVRRWCVRHHNDCNDVAPDSLCYSKVLFNVI